jgi:hypothetical protein
MSKNRLLISASLIGALIAAPAFAAMDKDKDKESEGHMANYKEHMQQRQQMHMDMMQAMITTMTILRDINHQPSADEKKKLTDLIKQMNDMMAKHKAMDESAMKSMDEKMGSQPMAPGHHDKH